MWNFKVLEVIILNFWLVKFSNSFVAASEYNPTGSSMKIEKYFTKVPAKGKRATHTTRKQYANSFYYNNLLKRKQHVALFYMFVNIQPNKKGCLWQT